MSARDTSQPPERLVHGKYGALIRQANREFESGLDQPAAFRRVEARLTESRNERAVARARWLFTAAPLAVAAALLLVRRQGAELAPELVAEPSRPAAALVATPPVTVAAPLGVAEAALPPAAPKREPRAFKPRAAPSSPSLATPTVEAEQALEPAHTEEAAPSPPGRETSEPHSETAAAPDCLSLARKGQTRAAEACFSQRALGAGLAAEMALFELARLRRDVLSDASGALRALTDYRARFPSGSLRREVEVSQLELLLQLGKTEDALRQSAELLASSTSGERASELRLLRGNLLRKQSRFAEAAREYELAEGAGARRGDATYFRALCLEALGRGAEAAAALAKYLEQSPRTYAEDAKRRLERLKP